MKCWSLGLNLEPQIVTGVYISMNNYPSLLSLHSFTLKPDYFSLSKIDDSISQLRDMDERITVLLKMVRDNYGKRLRYPKDVEDLAKDILEETGLSLSASTLRRLLGLEKKSTNPRLETLDILAAYVGYPTIDEFYIALENEQIVENHK